MSESKSSYDDLLAVIDGLVKEFIKECPEGSNARYFCVDLADKKWLVVRRGDILHV